MVALRVAQYKKPHTIVETFVLPCCKDIVGCFSGENATQTLDTLPLSNDTVHRRICDLSENIKHQVIAEIKEAPLGIFAIHLDESTDLASCAQLLACTRYVRGSEFNEASILSPAGNPQQREKTSMKLLPVFLKRRACLRKYGGIHNRYCPCSARLSV